MLIEVLTWDIDSLEKRIQNNQKQRMQFFLIFLLFLAIGIISTNVTETPKNISKVVANVVLIIGSPLNFFFQIINVFVVFKVIQLILKLNINNQQITLIALAGTIPIFISSCFNILCNYLFGYNLQGYTSLQHFYKSDNQIITNFLRVMNPFVIWQILLVSIIMVNLTSKNKKWIISFYILIFLIIRILFG